MAVGVWLFRNLRADTGFILLSPWMLIAGLGVGPTMAIFTLIVRTTFRSRNWAPPPAT